LKQNLIVSQKCQIELSAIDSETGKTFRIDFHSHLYGKQAEHIMPIPDLVVQFCHFIAQKYKYTAFGGTKPILRANVSFQSQKL